MAVASLVCALLAVPGAVVLFVPGLALGVTAYVLGVAAARRLATEPGLRGGERLARAGRLIGLVAAAAALLGMGLLGLFLLVGGGGAWARFPTL